MVLLSGVLEVDYEGQDPVRVLPGTYAYGPAEDAPLRRAAAPSPRLGTSRKA